MKTKTKADPVFNIILRVVRDTCEGFPLEIVELLYQNPDGLSKDDLAEMLEISPAHVYNILNRDMKPVGIVTFVKVKNNSGNRGRNTHLFTLTSELWSICRKVFK